MARIIRVLLGVIAIGAVLLISVVGTLLTGIRRQSPAILDRVRRVNKAVFNPRAIRTAGQPGDTYSIVEHVGRVSGAVYRTPVGAIPTDDGFVITLPYGTQADWVKNVLAAGSATIVDEGERVDVERPVLVPVDEAAEWFSGTDQKVHRVFGIERCLVVQRAGATGG